MLPKSSRAMHMAHHLWRNLQPPISNVSWSELLRHAWYFVHLREMMKTGIVRFSYFKQDGSIREARGTLCASLVPDDKKPHPVTDNPSPVTSFKTIPYYDLDRQDWRSFRITDFIGFVSVQPTDPTVA